MRNHQSHFKKAIWNNCNQIFVYFISFQKQKKCYDWSDYQICYQCRNKIYKFVKDLAKTKKDLKILGGIDLETKKGVSAEEFVKMAKLPTREQLLTQIAVMLTMPVKKVMIALNERSKTI